MTTQIKTTWREVKLGTLCSISTGKKDVNEGGEGGKYPFFTCARETLLSNDYSFDTDAILVVGNGSYTGFTKKYSGKFDLYQRTYALHDFDESADFKFLYYYMKEKFESKYMGGSHGAAIPYITKPILTDFEVLLPPRVTQKNIANTLSTYDDLIENNTKRIKILEEIAQAIYRELLVPSASKKWKIATLRDVIESYTGGGWGKEELDKDYSGPAYVIRGTDIPHASMGNISTCPLRYHKLSNLHARVLQDGDLVFEVSGGSKGQPVGRSLLVTTKLLDQFRQNVICASFCKLIRPDKNKISPFQIYEQILDWYENGVIEKYQVQSTGISNFRFESFIDEEKIALPSEETKKKFDNLVSPLFDEIYSLGSQNQKLRQARDLLLPKLVAGEIDVK